MTTPDPGNHYFESEPSVGSARSAVELTLPDRSFTLTTDKGVFARQGVDVGSKLLLLSGPDPISTDTEIVDIGAGYGPIALAVAARNPQARIWAVEVNARARELCQLNAQNSGLDNVSVISPEQFPDEIKIDRIWSNPPIRIGKAALHDLLSLWLNRLKPTGSAHLVVQKHLGSDSLARWLGGQGWVTTRRRSQKAYRVLDVSARQQGSP